MYFNLAVYFLEELFLDICMNFAFETMCADVRIVLFFSTTPEPLNLNSLLLCQGY